MRVNNADTISDDWHGWGNHVLGELRRQNDNIETLEKSHVLLCVKVGELRAYLVIAGAILTIIIPFVLWKVFQ